MKPEDLQAFERARPRLLGLAYRILGSRADADDAVQDCFLKWREADRQAIEQPAAWLSTACTRRCLDLLRAPHRSRVDYVGPWLPEPVQAIAPDDSDALFAESLTTAFLLLLERLTPKERAAYLLREVFEQPYPEIAAALELEETACRQLVSRAKSHIEQDRVRHQTPAATQDRLLLAFQTAIVSGDAAGLTAMLSSDIRLTSDGGGKAAAARHILQGQDALRFLSHASRWWDGYAWTLTDLNGGRGLVLTQEGRIMLTVSFGCDAEGRVCEIYIMRNPDKLMRLEPVRMQ